MKNRINLMGCFSALTVILLSGCSEKFNLPSAPAPTGPWVTTLAGSVGVLGATNGTGKNALFNNPTGIAVDSSGNVYVADRYNELIRKITSDGTVSTLAGSVGVVGFTNGSNALFNDPTGVAVDAAGNVYVADSGNAVVRKITPSGFVSTFATGFSIPWGITIDSAGVLYVSDGCSRTIYKVDSGSTSTYLGGFDSLFGVAVDKSENVYAVDSLSAFVMKISNPSAPTTFVGSGNQGSADGVGTLASFHYPCAIAVDSSGNIFVGDTYNAEIRKITPDGRVTTIAGSAEDRGYVDGSGTTALFGQMQGVAVDSAGAVYVADLGNNVIRKITF